jgi:predicted RNA-binding protein with RPS1 domain
MGSCIICDVPVDGGHVCDSHQEDVIFEFRGNNASQLIDNRFYEGTVDGYADFGVFIDLAPGVTGLLHRSELDRRLESLSWEPGDTVCIRVNNVRDNGNIDLGKSIRQSEREFRGKLILDGTEEKLSSELDDDTDAEMDAGDDTDEAEPATETVDETETDTELEESTDKVEASTGEAEPVDPVAGHIPGAQCRPSANNLTDTGHFKPAATLASELPDAPAVVAYCGSGITACHNVLAYAVAGRPLPRLYAGSWSEWITDGERPVATG